MKTLEQEFNKYHESGAILIGDPGLGGRGRKRVYDEMMAAVDKPPQAVRDGAYLPFQLYSGAAFNCRFTTEPLKPEEARQYVAFSAGRVIAEESGIFLADGFGILEPEIPIEDDDFSVVTIDVPPGDYLVTCYAFLPGPNRSQLQGGDRNGARQMVRGLLRRSAATVLVRRVGTGG